MNVKVSVCVVTYNQRMYIEQCLKTLLNQRTNFTYEIIVSDDASTDETQKVIAAFQVKFPHIIRAAYHKKNLGPTKNYIFAHRIARGEYIAHVDGDDYALPDKLQTLNDALDARPDVNIAWHRMLVLSRNRGLKCDKMKFWLQPKNGFGLFDLLATGTVGAHSAKIYRKSLRTRIGFQRQEIMDYYATIEHVRGGRAIWIKKIAGVYRDGIGIGYTAREKYSTMLIDHLDCFVGKYPDMRGAINAHALLLMLKDIALARNSTAYNLWRKTLCFDGIFTFFKYLPYYIISRI